MSHDQAVFGGSVPQIYREYLVPLIFDAYAQDLIERIEIPSEGAVLETACGTGALTKHLRRALPEAVRLVSTDLNGEMLALNRERLGEASNLTFMEADATALDFSDHEFDVVIWQYGIMFYPDKGAGFREAARVLKPGGAYLFNIWDSLAHHHFVQCVNESVQKMVPEDPPRFLEIPFSYHDLSFIKGELQEAGFGEIDIAVSPRLSVAPSAHHVAMAFIAGTPLAPQLAERGIDQSALETVESILLKEYGEGEISAPMQSISFVAKRV